MSTGDFNRAYFHPDHWLTNEEVLAYPVSADLKDMILELGGLTFRENVFIAREPVKPDNCVTIYDTTGFPFGLTLDGLKYRYESAQIRVRATDYLEGWRLINDIAEFLPGKHGTQINTYFYTFITSSTPMMLEWDKNNRVIFFININVQRR